MKQTENDNFCIQNAHPNYLNKIFYKKKNDELVGSLCMIFIV